MIFAIWRLHGQPEKQFKQKAVNSLLCQKIGKLLADLLVGGFTQNKDLWIRFSFFFFFMVSSMYRSERGMCSTWVRCLWFTAALITVKWIRTTATPPPSEISLQAVAVKAEEGADITNSNKSVKWANEAQFHAG